MPFFNKEIWSRKFLASLLVVALFIGALVFNVLLPPKPAKAEGDAMFFEQVVQYIQQVIAWAKDYSSQSNQEDSLDEIEDIQDWFKDDTLDRRSERESWNESRKDMLDELVNDILSNIQDIGNGQSAFVDGWKDFLTNKTDTYFQNFVSDELNQAAICDTFKSETQEELSSGNEPSYSAQAECPLEDPAAMKNGTSKDFWTDWMSIIRPSGNPFGSFMIADDEKIEQEALGFTAEYGKLIANQGNQGTPDTPGILQSYAAQRASMMDLDYLLNSADLETYFSSVADAFINKITEVGLSNFNTGAARPTTPNIPTVPAETANLNFIKSNYDIAQRIPDKLNLILENLDSLERAGGIAGARRADTNTALTDITDLISKMELVYVAEGTGNTAQINAAVNTAKTAYDTAVSSLQAMLTANRDRNTLKLLTPLIEDYNDKIVDEATTLNCNKSWGGCL